MAGYIGTTPVPQATQHRESFTATGGQTSFATAGYTPQFIDVYLNGVKLAPADYTATNGSDVVLASGATASDILEIVAYTPFEVANQTFTGDTSVTNLAVTGTFTSRGIDDNADAVAITIDSSENVGIGTSSIDNKVNIQESALAGRSASNGNTSMTIEHATDTGIQFFSATQTQLRFGDAASTGAGAIIYEHATDKLRLSTDSLMTFEDGGVERMRLNSSGSLILDNNANGGQYLFLNTSAAGDGHIILQRNSANKFQIAAGTSNELQFYNYTAGSESMRLDASGNLLVGKTSSNTGSLGAEFRQDGLGVFGRSADYPLILNRTTNDGGILLFRKDGTTVGSIGHDDTSSATHKRTYIGYGDTGLAFIPTLNEIVGHNTSTNAPNSSITLGDQNVPFEDLYLSGGVYLGGTGAANKLTVYEEGTHDLVAYGSASGTKTFSYNASVQGLRYTKIGNKVFCELLINNQNLPTYTGDLRFSLPFTSAGGAFESLSGDLYFYPTSAWDGFSNFTGLTSRLGSSTNYLSLGIKVLDADRQTILGHSNSSTSGAQVYLRFSFTYTAA